MRPITDFESRMRVAFGLAFAVLFGTIAVSVFIINRLCSDGYWVSHTHQVISQINATHVKFGDVRVSTKNYLLSRQGRHLAPRISAMQSIDDIMSRIRWLTSDNPRQQGNFDETYKALHEYYALTSHIIADVERQKTVSFSQFAQWADRTEPAGRKVASCFTKMRSEEEGLLVEREKAAHSFVNQAYSILPFMLAIQAVITLYLYYGVLNHVDSPK